jgi:two-component system phosphate regulon sensor histidine kinase PhoR
LNIPAHSPPILGNADYLERAVVNLLENAIKYTPANGQLAVTIREEAPNAVIEVRDNGIGIPPADLPRIFERFYRVDRSRSREMGGTGLGLAIVKHIVQAHGGSVDVVSEAGCGSTFRILLPLATET